MKKIVQKAPDKIKVLKNKYRKFMKGVTSKKRLKSLRKLKVWLDDFRLGRNQKKVKRDKK